MMKYIKKRREPQSLTEYKKIPGAKYDDYRDKDDLCLALMEEQGFICCYCMQRIKSDTAHIEHWKPQSVYPGSQLDYHNLLAVCAGNKGNPEHLQHCDTLKKNIEISIDPTNPGCEKLVKFGSGGNVYSDNEKVDQELNTVLNLNLKMFRDNRMSALDFAIGNLLAVKPKGSWPKTILKKEIHKWESLGVDGKYKPYCRVVISYLEKKLPGI